MTYLCVMDELNIFFTERVPLAFEWKWRVLCNIEWWSIDLSHFWSYTYNYRMPRPVEHKDIPKEILLYIAIQWMWFKRKSKQLNDIFLRSIEWYDEYFWTENDWIYKLKQDVFFKSIKIWSKWVKILKPQ